MIDLAEAIQQLRAQLVKAVEEGKDKELKFGLDTIELELQVAVTKGAGGKAGIKVWLINAEGDSSVAKESLQKVKLVLKPKGPGGGEVLLGDTSWEDDG
jgi:hypothetical protein